MVWRFVAVDVDGGYFRPAEDGAPRDYGDIADFVALYIRFKIGWSRQWSLTHQYFEVVQAVDDDGNPRFITMPGEESRDNADRLPVLELRLRTDAPDQIIPGQFFTLILKGGGDDFYKNEVSVRFAVPPIAAREPDSVVITGGDSVTLPIDENIVANPSQTERGDAFLVYDVNATKDRTAPDIEWSLEGTDKDAFGINSDGEVWFLASPNYEDKSSYSVTIIAEAGDQSARQAVTVTVNDVPEAPVLSIISPAIFPLIFTGVTQKRIDTGYRLSATDQDGDNVLFRANENPRFFIRNGNELWIKADQTFNHEAEPEITVRIKAIDDSTSKLKDIKTITFDVLDPTELLNITSTAPTSVKENVTSNDDASSRGDAAIIYHATAQLSTPNKAVEWRLEGSDANSFGIDDNGNIWFRASPNYESAKKSYNFDLVASAANGQLTDKQSITINITDVDEQPTEMSLNKDAKTFSDTIDVKDGKKLTLIKFEDNKGENGAIITQSIDRSELPKILQRETMKINQNSKLLEILYNENGASTNQSTLFEIKKGTKSLELWLKAGVNLKPDIYLVQIKSDSTGEGKPPPPVIFMLEITGRGSQPDTQENSNEDNKQGAESDPENKETQSGEVSESLAAEVANSPATEVSKPSFDKVLDSQNTEITDTQFDENIDIPPAEYILM